MLSAEHQSNKDKFNLKPAPKSRQLSSSQKRAPITVLITDSFQLLLIGCGRLPLPEQCLALVKQVCMALKGTGALCAGQEEITEH